MRVKPPAPTLRLSVDTEALAHNWKVMDSLSGTARAGAAVKADCYGLGVDTCIPALRDAGCRDFFVAHWSEVEAAAAHIPPEQIAVLHGPVTSQEAAYGVSIGAIPVINSVRQAALWSEAGGTNCHLMVDTGINRLGVSLDQLGSPEIQALSVDVLMSHLASADEDSTLNGVQLEKYRDAVTRVAHRRKSLANSAGVALGPDYAFELTRPGLSLYGGVPREELASDIRQVASIECAILQIRELRTGDSVGYNAEFTATQPIKTGVVSLGYADGFLRARGRNAALLSEGRNLPILGKVSMDMVVVDLTLAPDLVEADFVEIPFSLPDIARQSSVSQYELLTTIGPRLRH
jgi:alanine racemase